MPLSIVGKSDQQLSIDGFISVYRIDKLEYVYKLR